MKVYNILFIFALLLVIIPFTSAIDVSSCQEISAPGTYNLINNLNADTQGEFTGACIYINSNLVELNANGYSITANSTMTAAVSINGNTDVTIKNAEIIGAGVSYGIFNTGSSTNRIVYDNNVVSGTTSECIRGTSNHNITNNNLTDCGNVGLGINRISGFGASSNVRIINNYINTSTNGMLLDRPTNDYEIINNTIETDSLTIAGRLVSGNTFIANDTLNFELFSPSNGIYNLSDNNFYSINGISITGSSGGGGAFPSVNMFSTNNFNINNTIEFNTVGNVFPILNQYNRSSSYLFLGLEPTINQYWNFNLELKSPTGIAVNNANVTIRNNTQDVLFQKFTDTNGELLADLLEFTRNSTTINYQALQNMSILTDYYDPFYKTYNNTLEQEIFESLTLSGFIENNQTFQTPVVETSEQTFNINFSYDSSSFPIVLASLFYDGTEVVGTNTGSGDNGYFSAVKQIPTITNTSEIKSFYWTINLQSANGTIFSFNSTTQQQNVTELTLAVCSGTGITIVNFTAAREDNLTTIDPFKFEGTFTYTAGDGEITKTVDVPSEIVSSKSICLEQEDVSNFTIKTAQISYDGPTPGVFVERDYFMQDQVFTNGTTTNVTLYLLEAGDSTSFIQVVQNQNIVPVTGALILVERFYPGLNEYRTVQISETDDDGKSVGFYKTETVDYRHTITKDGETLLVTNKQKIVPGESPFTLTFTIGSIITTPLQTFEDIENFDGTLVFNATSKIVTFTYEDLTGNLTLAQLKVQKVNAGTLDTVICNVTATTQSGILTCDLSLEGGGTFIAQAFIQRSPSALAKAIQFVITEAIDIFGTTGLFLAWFIILAAAMIGIWNPTVGIIITNLAVIMVNLIGLATFQPIFIFALVGVSLVIVILMKT